MSASATAKLPNDVDALKVMVQDLQQQVSRQNSMMQVMQDEIALLQRLNFAKSSEKWSNEETKQMRLFDEAESIVDESPGETEARTEQITYTRQKKGRKPIPEDIPREEVIYELEDDERCCPHCDALRPEMGFEESEELQYIPARTVVKRHRRKKYGPCSCPAFAADESAKSILTAPGPVRILPGSIASSGLLAYILTSKFCDALPFYRQSRLLERNDIHISRANMANWTLKVAAKCELLIDLMRKRSREGPLLNMDETTVQVLKESGRKAETKSYMWVSVSSSRQGKIVLFHYSRTRSADVPLSLLAGFSGVLQSDGYVGYNKAVARFGLTHIGCLAHIRRKFHEAAKITKSGGPANKPLKLIGKIYKVEKDLIALSKKEDISPNLYAHLRRKNSAPYWKALHKWLKEMRHQTPPKTALGKAVGYAWNEFPKVVRYLVHPEATPDNNIAERAIRPFVVGRKNWLFSDSPRGAHASAVMYSLIETAQANGLNPQEYLYRVFEELPTISEGDSDALERLLPWNIGDVGK